MCSMLQKRGEDLAAKDRNEIAFRIKLIDEAVKSTANAVLVKHDLTLAQMRAIGYLAEHKGSCAQKDLEDKFCVRHSTLIGVIKRLCAKDMVAVETDSTDKRKRIIHLTEKGETVWKELMGTLDGITNRMLFGMTEKEIDCLSALLGRVYTNLTSKTTD
jgi:DNA-binding MarR family transcriptional regulator